jgi:hypothetical protein
MFKEAQRPIVASPLRVGDFELQVLADLAELKTQMRLLVGNGQPGRVQVIEARLEKHEMLVQRAIGIGALAGFVTTMLNLLINYLRSRL